MLIIMNCKLFLISIIISIISFTFIDAAQWYIDSDKTGFVVEVEFSANYSIDSDGYIYLPTEDDSINSFSSEPDYSVNSSQVREILPEKFELSISPNPFNSFVTLNFSNPFTGIIEIINILVRVVNSVNLNSSVKTTIDFIDQPSGVLYKGSQCSKNNC